MGRKRLDNKPMSVRLAPTVREVLLDMATARGLTVTEVLRDVLTVGVSVLTVGAAGSAAGSEVHHG